MRRSGHSDGTSVPLSIVLQRGEKTPRGIIAALVIGRDPEKWERVCVPMEERSAQMQVWRLGSYELVRPLGEGGMAQVYLARDIRLGREVAVKVLDPQLAERSGFQERFLREARVAAALDHPNIVPLYDFGESEFNLYLVMPFISGGSLQDKLKRAPFSPGEAAKYVSQIADALDYAHQRSVVHRDVKPANMLIHADGRVMLSDFGLAKILGGPSRASAPRGRPDAGTPEYMAPEQVEGNTDARSDIYALGVVLYLLLTGHLPFAGTTSNAVMDGHLYRLPEPPRLLNSSITPAMQEVVLRALAKHPEDRFQKAGELGAALMAALVAGDVEPLPFGGPSSPSVPLLSMPSFGRASIPLSSHPASLPWNLPQTDPAAINAHASKPWTSPALGGGATGAPSAGMRTTRAALSGQAPVGLPNMGMSHAFPLIPPADLPTLSPPPSAASVSLPPPQHFSQPNIGAASMPEMVAHNDVPIPAAGPARALPNYRLSAASTLWPWLAVALVVALIAAAMLIVIFH